MQKKYIGILCLLIVSKSHAVPTLYPEKINLGIRNTTNSSYLADSDDPKKFYVLPPSKALVKAKNLHTVTANVGFCKEIANLQKYNLETVELLNSLKNEGTALRNQMDQEGLKLLQANEELSQFVLANDAQELAALDSKILQTERRLDQLYVRYKNCSNDCQVLLTDIESSQQLRTELSIKRFELSSANLFVTNEYEKKKIKVVALEKNIGGLKEDLQKIQSNLKDLYYEFSKMYDAHAMREGARVTLIYDSQWSENVIKLNQDNHGYLFEKIQTKNAQIKLSSFSASSLPNSGGIVGFSVGGAKASDVLSLESYPDAFSAQATLSLLSACPLLYPEWFGLSKDYSIDDLNYGLVVSYEYPSQMKLNLTARYNMYKTYQLIKSQGTQGGFFSSHSWSNQDEEEFFKDSFSVEWNIQDDQQKISFEKKKAIESDLRKQMLSRLAGYLVMADPQLKNGLDIPNSETGAMVLSDSLNKFCPHVYCKGASVVLSVMQAIFGSSSSEQQLKQKINVEMVDRYSELNIVMQPMLTTYR